MPLEDLISGLTAALEANTKAIAAQTSFMQSMAKGGAPVDPPVGSGKATVTEAAPKEEPKPAAPTGKTPAQTLVDLAGTYMRTGDKEQSAKNTALAKRVLAHTGATKFSAMPEDKLEEALQMMTALSEGRTPEQFAEAETTAEEDLV